MKFTAFDYSQLSACFSQFSKPARRALINNKIFHLEDLAKLSQDEVRKLHGIGPLTLLKLDEMLASKGLALRSPPFKRKSRDEIFRV